MQNSYETPYGSPVAYFPYAPWSDDNNYVISCFYEVEKGK